ncbi:MAG: hypothetical protein NTY53_24310 [Kiritimatiellaeota bacterium]|nr:hypothetical protein [Kiritimatiellota bacterium]
MNEEKEIVKIEEDPGGKMSAEELIEQSDLNAGEAAAHAEEERIKSSAPIKLLATGISAPGATLGALSGQASLTISNGVTVAKTWALPAPVLLPGPCTTNQMVAQAISGGYLYTCCTGASTLTNSFTTNLLAICNTGVGQGLTNYIYRLTAWGSTTTDVPIAGAVAGGWYFACATTNAALTPTPDQFSKVLFGCPLLTWQSAGYGDGPIRLRVAGGALGSGNSGDFFVSITCTDWGSDSMEYQDAAGQHWGIGYWCTVLRIMRLSNGPVGMLVLAHQYPGDVWWLNAAVVEAVYNRTMTTVNFMPQNYGFVP